MFNSVRQVFLATAMAMVTLVPTTMVQAQEAGVIVENFQLLEAERICVFVSTFTNKTSGTKFMVGIALNKGAQEAGLSFKLEQPFTAANEQRLFDVYLVNDDDISSEYGSVRFVGVDAEPGTQYVGALPPTFLDDLTDYPIIGVMDGDEVIVAFQVPTNDPAFLSELKQCANEE